MAITRASLLTLEAYAKVRKANQVEVIAHRKLRTVRSLRWAMTSTWLAFLTLA